MEIFLDKRAIRQLRLAVADAIEDGEVDSLREELVSIFTDEDIEEIERRIDSGDFYDFVSEILDEWSSEDVDELFELLEAQLAEANVDLKYSSPEADDEEAAEAPEEEEESDLDLVSEGEAEEEEL